MKKKNCLNCKYLEWGFGDVGDPEGWMCNKRDYRTDKQEMDHLEKLDRKSYREQAKKCCSLK